MKPKAAILFTSGTNCDYETSLAFELAGGVPTLVNTSEIKNQKKLNSFQVIIIPGGFSYGDHLGSATIWSNELQVVLGDRLLEFLESGKLILGVCNGFQVLVKLGIVPDTLRRSSVESSLRPNAAGVFESRWVRLKTNQESTCVFSQGLSYIDMPVAHGEGNFVPADLKTFDEMVRSNQIVFQYVNKKGDTTTEYPANPNGSFAAIAGICDPTGRALGLMPHPERFIYRYQNLKSAEFNGKIGLSVYKNAVDYFK